MMQSFRGRPRFEGSLAPWHPGKPLAGIAVEGNRQIKTEQILGLVKTKSGQVPKARQVREDVDVAGAIALVFHAPFPERLQ